MERHSHHSPETLQKLCFSTKISHQEIGINYGILSSEGCELLNQIALFHRA